MVCLYDPVEDCLLFTVSKLIFRDVVVVGFSRLLMVVDSRQQLIGNANKENIQQALRTLAIFPFTRRLGMTMEEADILVGRARTDAANTSLKAYFPL